MNPIIGPSNLRVCGAILEENWLRHAENPMHVSHGICINVTPKSFLHESTNCAVFL